MANLLTDLSLTSAYTVTGSFAVITGMTTTVTIAGTGSVVLLAMTLNPELVSDECAEYRFTHDGSRVGPVVSSFVDATNEGTGRSLFFALTGLSAGSHTFAVEAANRSGTAVIDTNFVRTFQVIEIETGASILVDLETSASEATPATYADMTGLSADATPNSASSLLLFIHGSQILGTAGQEASIHRFAIDGTQDGPEMTNVMDNIDETTGCTMVFGKTGVSATSQTFSVQSERLLGTPNMDTARPRIFQVVEIETNFDLLVDVESVSADSAASGYTDMTDMTGSPDIDSTDSIGLLLFNYTLGGGADTTSNNQFEIGTTQDGPEVSVWSDAVDRPESISMAFAITGESGVTDIALRWQNRQSTAATNTSLPRTFQFIDFKAVADAEAALTGVVATPAVGTVDVEHDQALSGVEATPAVGTVTPSTTVDLSGVESVTAVGTVGFTESGQVDLSGVESPTAVGSVTPSTTVELSGVEATPEVGSVTPSTSVELSGVESVTAVGNVAEEHDGLVELVGVEAVTAVGNVGVEESGQVDLSGVESVTAVGFVGVINNQTLAGVEATPEVGTVGVDNVQDLVGVEATPAVGTVTPSTTVELSGVESVTAVGNVVAVLDAQAALSGVESPSAVDSVGVEHDQALAGVEATPEVGFVTPSTTVELSGVETVSAVGNVAEEHDGLVELTGVEAVSAVGNVGVEESGQVDLAGVESPSAVDSVGVEHDQALAGVESPSAVGSVTPSTTVELSGVESVTAVGNVAVEADVERALSGVESPSAVGTVGVLHEQELSGVEATTAVDSVGVVHEQALSGVEILPQVGSVTPSTTIELSGVESQSAVGFVGAPVPALGDVYNAAAFFPTLSSVTIELWDPISGASKALDDNTCNELIGEGVFVWDSTKLTTQPTSSYQEYLWKMTDGITEVAGVIRMSITVEDVFDRVMENGETFGESLLLIRANAAGSIAQDGAGSYKIKSADGLTDRIEGDPAVNDGRDITATDVT